MPSEEACELVVTAHTLRGPMMQRREERIRALLFLNVSLFLVHYPYFTHYTDNNTRNILMHTHKNTSLSPNVPLVWDPVTFLAGLHG